MQKYKLIKQYPNSPILGSVYNYDDFVGDYGYAPDFNMSEFWEKVEKNYLFTTVDGKELNFGDVFFTVDTERFNVYAGSAGITFQKEKWTKNAYSTRELAEEWIELNEPKYSVKDMVDVVNNWAMCGIDEYIILSYLKNKQAV